jgi:hypothetical protein
MRINIVVVEPSCAGAYLHERDVALGGILLELSDELVEVLEVSVITVQAEQLAFPTFVIANGRSGEWC